MDVELYSSTCILSDPLALHRQVFTSSVFSSSSDATVFPSTLSLPYVFYGAVEKPRAAAEELDLDQPSFSDKYGAHDGHATFVGEVLILVCSVDAINVHSMRIDLIQF